MRPACTAGARSAGHHRMRMTRGSDWTSSLVGRRATIGSRRTFGLAERSGRRGCETTPPGDDGWCNASVTWPQLIASATAADTSTAGHAARRITDPRRRRGRARGASPVRAPDVPDLELRAAGRPRSAFHSSSVNLAQSRSRQLIDLLVARRLVRRMTHSGHFQPDEPRRQPPFTCAARRRELAAGRTSRRRKASLPRTTRP
jgi:hypothetical protein